MTVAAPEWLPEPVLEAALHPATLFLLASGVVVAITNAGRRSLSEAAGDLAWLATVATVAIASFAIGRVVGWELWLPLLDVLEGLIG